MTSNWDSVSWGELGWDWDMTQKIKRYWNNLCPILLPHTTFAYLPLFDSLQVAVDGSNCQGVPTEIALVYAPHLDLGVYGPPIAQRSD